MRFRILGPLEVTRDGRPVAVPGRHHPRLLVALLAEPNQVVAESRLVEALWRADPPDSALRQVQNNVAALRRRLGLDRDRLGGVGRGYRITVDDDDLDLLRCRTSLATAQDHRAAGRLAEAEAAVSAALAEWRGPALSGVPGDPLPDVARRLDEWRLNTMEECFDLRLDLGRHDELIGDLSELSARYPTRQRFAGQLMLALYRAGRGPEALDLFRTVRDRLAEELGVDPGQHLRDLNTAVLRDDPALLRTAAAPPSPERRAHPVPAQLPAAIGSFVGREAELRELELAPPGSPVVVCGPGGVGKTALVLHWAHRHVDEFPDGQLYVDLCGFDRRDSVKPIDALRFLLTSLGQRGEDRVDDEAEAAARFRSVVSNRKLLILLDNARDADQVAPLLVGTGVSRVVVTSRHRMARLMALHDARTVSVEVFSTAESNGLLDRMIPELVTDRDATDRLIERCAGIPLALRVAVASLLTAGHRDIRSYLDELERVGRLRGLVVDADESTAVAGTIAVSVDALDPAARESLVKLATVPGADLPRDLADRIGVDPSSVTRLEAAHLLERHLADRVRMHDLTREYLVDAIGRGVATVNRAEVAAAVIGWYFDHRRAFGSGDYQNALSAHREYRDLAGGWRLLVGTVLLLRFGQGDERLRAQAEWALSRAEETDDLRGRLAMTNLLCAYHSLYGDPDEAARLKNRELAIVRETGDADDLVVAQIALGVFLSRRSDIPGSESAYREALRLIRDRDSPLRLFQGLCNLAEVRVKLGRLGSAAELLAEAEPMAERFSPAVAAQFDITTGFLALARSELSVAAVAIDRALAVARQENLARFVVGVLQMRMRLRLATGEPDAALADGIEAAAIVIPGGNDLEVLTGGLLARAAGRVGDHRSATDHLRHGLAASRSRSNAEARAELYGAGCEVWSRVGEPAAAVEHGESAVRLAEPVGAPLLLATVTEDLATGYTAAGRSVEARRCRDRAAELRRAVREADPASSTALVGALDGQSVVDTEGSGSPQRSPGDSGELGRISG